MFEVNIDIAGVVAELKGIRIAQEKTAAAMAEILEAVRAWPPLPNALRLQQDTRRISVADRVRASREALAASRGTAINHHR